MNVSTINIQHGVPPGNNRRFHSFLLKEMIISSGIINGVLNGLIYYATTKNNVSLFSFMLNLLFTMIILSAILMPIYPALVRMKLKKLPDLNIPYTQESHLLAAKYPGNKMIQAAITVILCTIICTPFGVGIAGCFGLTELTRIQGTIIKGITCGLCSAIAYYFTAIFVFFNRQR